MTGSGSRPTWGMAQRHTWKLANFSEWCTGAPTLTERLRLELAGRADGGLPARDTPDEPGLR
jgi:hypothetical protein